MAFWSMTSSLSMAGATEKLLDRGSFSLAELLDCDDILNQVLAPNDRVIKYLSQPEIINELVSYALAPPTAKRAVKPSEDEEKEKDAPEQEPNEKASEPEPKEPEPKEQNDKADEESGSKETEYESFGGESFEYHEFQNAKTSNSDDDGGGSSDEDDDEEERQKRTRYAKVSAEILTTDIWTLLDALLSNETAMRNLWSLLDPSEPEVSTQQLALLTKIVEGLLEKRLDRMLDFIRTLPHFVDYFIRYIECQPLVDFLIKVISTDHPESPNDIIEFLYEQNLVPKMIDLLGPDVPHSAQSAAGDFLKAFVNISGGNKSDICAIGPNELSRQFVSTRCMQRLIDLMLCGGHGMCVAVTVIIEVIRKNNSDYDFVDVLDTTLASHPPDPRDNIYLGTMVKLFARAIPKFQEMLVAPEHRVMKMPFGEIKPLGFERFRICELYAELLHCSNMNLLNDPRGEEVVRERDLERVRVFFPDRVAQFEADEAESQQISSEEIKEQVQTHDEAKDEVTNKAKDDAKDDAKDGVKDGETSAGSEKAQPTSDDGIGIGNDEDEDEDDTASVKSPAADPPYPSDPPSSPPAAASPLESPSPTTPENETLDYVENDDQQKLNVSELRGTALAESLRNENKLLRERFAVGDQLKIALDDNKCIDSVVSLLFEFPWNNFLHNVVFDIVQQVFNGYIDHSYNKFLAINLFERAHITDHIVNGQRANDEYEQEHHIRLGYVGHLTLISEEVVKFETLFVPESISPGVAAALSQPAWDTYVQNDLMQLREQYNTVLGRAGTISEGESFEIQDDEEGRVRALELNLIDDGDDDDEEDELRGLRRTRSANDSDSESESDSDSDLEEGDEDDMLALVPQRHHNSDDEDDGTFELEEELDDVPVADLSDTKRYVDESGREPEESVAERSAEKAAASEASNKKDAKGKDDVSEFSRYMTEHLSQGSRTFDSESSDDEDDDRKAGDDERK